MAPVSFPSQYFDLSHFFRKWGKLYFERWTQFAIKYIILPPFTFPCQIFHFLNFFRTLWKLYFEQWMQIAIKYIKGPSSFRFQLFHFSQLFRFFSTFFKSWGNITLNHGRNLQIYNIGPFSFPSQLFYFSQLFRFSQLFSIVGETCL